MPGDGAQRFPERILDAAVALLGQPQPVFKRLTFTSSRPFSHEYLIAMQPCRLEDTDSCACSAHPLATQACELMVQRPSKLTHAIFGLIG